MMLLLSILAVLFSIATASEIVLGALSVNDPCTGADDAPGVCISTSACTNKGGTFISGACPGTPADIKCCSKTACGTDGLGNCRFESSCASGITESGQCPGPSAFKCCLPPGTIVQPRLPSRSSGCQQVSIDGAKAMIDEFPGVVKRIDCIGDAGHCLPTPHSDHCGGFAVDMMVNLNGVKTDAGEPIAEWIMQYHNDFSVKYILWGHKGWIKSRNDPEAPWSEWKLEPDHNNGDVTANHWDHVHVSFLE